MNAFNEVLKPLDKSLELVVYRSLKSLRRRDIDISPQTISDIWTLAKLSPDLAEKYLKDGLQLSLENSDIKSVQEFMHYGVVIALKRPDQLAKYHELTKIYKKKTDKWNYSFISFSPSIFIEAPESINSYFNSGLNLIMLDDSPSKFLAEAFFKSGADVAIKKPHKLKKYVEYIKKIHSIDTQTTSFISDAPNIIINSPEVFEEYAKTSLKLLREQKKRLKITGYSSLCSMWYQCNSLEIIKTNPDRLSLFGDKALELLKNKYISPKVAEGFLCGGKDLLLNFPQYLPKYIEQGIIIDKKILRYTYLEPAIYFMGASKILMKQPQKFQNYIRDTFKIFNIRNKEDKNSELAVTYLSYGSEVLLNYPQIYEKYMKYSKKIIQMDADLGELFLSTVSKDIMLNTEVYDNFYKITLNLLEKSTLIAEKFLKNVENSDEKSKSQIDTMYKLLPNQPSPKLKILAKEIDINSIKSKYSNIPLQAYNKLNVLIKKIGKKDLSVEEQNIFQQLPEELRKEIANYSFLKGIKDGPMISSILNKNKSFPTIDELTEKFTGIKDDCVIKSKRLLVDLTEDLIDYLSKDKQLSEECLEELDVLYNHINNNLLRSSKIRIEQNSNRLDDYFSEHKDCLSAKGKYSNEAQTFLNNSNSFLISINSYIEGKVSRKIFSKEVLGRIITSLAEMDNKRVWYIAGFSGSFKISEIPEWKKEVYEILLNTAKMNKDKIEGIFFDLNPRNRDFLSHSWADYVATQLGLEKNIDYRFSRKNISTEKFPTHRKYKTFELNNPEWQAIKIVRDEGLEGNFFLESVMREPKNKEICSGIKPDLIYDKGYIIGKYLEIQ